MRAPKCSRSMIGLPASAACLSIMGIPADTSSGVQKLGNHPSPSLPTLRSSLGAKPPSQISSGS